MEDLFRARSQEDRQYAVRADLATELASNPNLAFSERHEEALRELFKGRAAVVRGEFAISVVNHRSESSRCRESRRTPLPAWLHARPDTTRGVQRFDTANVLGIGSDVSR